MHTDRRRFLKGAAGLGAAAAWAAQPPVELPKVKFREHEITRLIIGSNPFYGYSHFNSTLDGIMREWYTQDRKIQVLKHAEETGINTWQSNQSEDSIADWKRLRAEGGKMNVLILSNYSLEGGHSTLPLLSKMGALGVAHHGGRTDERFREGKMELVREFLNAVHDAGMPAGVSSHNPAAIEYIEERGWPADFYMTCMYRVTRTREEARKEFGEAPLGETFMERDPERMCNVVRKTGKTCFAFKVMGAGRNEKAPEDAFRYVLTHIKPQDAVIVGMFPKFKDEVRENAELVRKVLAG